MHITHDDVKKLAKMARVEVRDDELDAMAAQLQAVLAYAERVCQVAADIPEEILTQENVLRQDVVQVTDPDPIIAQAPVRHERFFVVPHIMQNTGE